MYMPVRRPSSLRFSDVKIMIRDFLCPVREHVAKPDLHQNADTSVFSLGDFWRILALSGLGDLIGDRPLYWC